MNERSDFLDLANFKKGKKIGKGGYGKVYKIIENQTKKIYAAKISKNKIDFNSKEKFCLYAREVNIISKLNHPSILKFIGFSPTNFTSKSHPVIVTEFESNGSLDYILELERKKCAPEYWNDTKKLINIYGIASAMSYLHSNNILHRDLKPQNILEDDYLFPKIADFGLSKLYPQNRDSSSFQSGDEIKGTFTYIAPEVYKGEKYVSASDVFSFAIIVYEIITNRIPFEEYNQYQFVYTVVNKNERPKIQKSVGKSYRNLITRCWSSDPKDRPSFKQILNDLKTDEGFITENVDKEDYFSYISYIDQYNTTFDPRREIIKFNEITRRHSKTFTKISISPFSNIDCDDEYLAFYNQLAKTNGFSELLEETQQIFKNCIIQQHSKNKSIQINYNDTNFLYCNNSLSSFNFINALKYFEEISIEINVQSNIFDSIYTNVLQIKQNFIQNIKVVLVFNGKSDVNCRFSYNNQINSIMIQPSVTKIENRAFSNCLLLKEISMCSTVKYVGEFCFSNCISLNKIDIKSASITQIENGLFNGCSFLREITIPFSVEKIGSLAFNGCLSLEKVVIPTTVKIIEDSCFYECKNLRDISMSSSLETIGENAFYGCSSLTEITVPPSVKFIKSRAFHRCSSLTTINLPILIESIEPFTFKECTSLSKVNMSDSIKLIGDSSFFDCTSLIDINVPNSVEVIGDSAFFGCSSLESISIPQSVTTIGDSAFFGCSSLTEISIPTSIESLSKEIFSKCSKLKKISLHDSITSICWYSFNGCNLLNQIEIPISVTSIGGFSFNDCWNLKKISIPSSVTIIPRSCFKGCYSLEEIFIPNSITEICESAFNCCTSLKEIKIPDSVASIGDSTFFGCSSLTEIKISNSITKIENETFSRCSNLKHFSIPHSVTCIQNSAFFKCSLLEKILIPSSVVSIGDSAFSRCASLTDVCIPSSVVTIGKEAFSKCYSITNIVIPSSVIFMGEKVFLGCLALNDISIPSSTVIVRGGYTSNLRSKTEMPFKSKKEEMLKMLKIRKNTKLTFF